MGNIYSVLKLKVLGSFVHCRRNLIVNLASLWGILSIYYWCDWRIWLMYFNDTS